MPMIDFSFSGYIQDYQVDKAINAEGKEVDVSSMSARQLCKALNSGKLFISLEKALEATNRGEINLTDFVESI